MGKIDKMMSFVVGNFQGFSNYSVRMALSTTQIVSNLWKIMAKSGKTAHLSTKMPQKGVFLGFFISFQISVKLT